MPAEILRLVRAGALVPIARGAFVSGDKATALSHSDRYRLSVVAVAARSPGLVVSHQSAAALHGFVVWPATDVVHQTRVKSGASHSAPRRRIHSAAMSGADISRVEGLDVTGVARTLVDIARLTDLESAVVTIDAALRVSAVDSESLDATLSRPHRAGGQCGSPSHDYLTVLGTAIPAAGLDGLEGLVDPVPRRRGHG